MLAPNFPTRATAAYPGHIVEDGAMAPDVTDWMVPSGQARDALIGAQRIFANYARRPAYLALTPSQRNYVQMWGLMTGSEYDRLVALVEASKDYRVVHVQGSGILAQYVGPR